MRGGFHFFWRDVKIYKHQLIFFFFSAVLTHSDFNILISSPGLLFHYIKMIGVD